MAESLFERMSKLALKSRQDDTPFRIADLGKEPKMQLFHKIDDAVAIIRDGVYYRQTDLYHRGGTVYIKLPRGYCRIVARFGSETEYGTCNPNVKLIEYSDDVGLADDNRTLKYTGR